MPGNNSQFYSDLQTNKMPLGELFSRERLFHNVPKEWHVVITDIKGSTNAVLQGKHEEVNLIATGSIVSVLNIAFPMNITIPFFFGGDGATFLIPEVLIDKVTNALMAYRKNTFENSGLDLRVGSVTVESVYANGHDIRIAKFSSAPSFSIPIVLGNGLNYAEQIIKGEEYLLSKGEPFATDLDLSGMQCRWDEIPPPENKEEIVTLLVVACEVSQQSSAFKKILEKIDDLYGTPDKRQPISVAKLKLKTTFNRLGAEMRARLGNIKWIELIREWFVSLYGYIYFNTTKGKKYLKTLVDMSDTLVIDGKINTVISGTAKQREALQQLLDQMEDKGTILYGLHISSASIMSCYVRNLEESHIHFVDGSGGGYTKAAGMLKTKL